MLRGSGRQYIGAIMNFIGYYVIGLPLGITLALKVKWGVLGLWIGMCIGNIVYVRLNKILLTYIVVLWPATAVHSNNRQEQLEQELELIS